MTDANSRFAALWSRFLALLVDLLVFCSVFFPATRLAKGVWLMGATGHRWNRGLFITDPRCIAFLLVMLLYFAFLEGLAGVTIGKWIAGLPVVQATGGRPGLVRGLLRNVLRVICVGLPRQVTRPFNLRLPGSPDMLPYVQLATICAILAHS